MRQPTLFDRPTDQAPVDVERVILCALGDFQARGKVLIGRELPLDRLRGALRRASAEYKIETLIDEVTVAVLESLGAHVNKVPSYVAKHPFRVIVPSELADRARRVYKEVLAAKTLRLKPPGPL